jgi:disulfide bond formation protein DsbB
MIYRIHIAYLLALAALLPLGGALLSQYGFGYAPCELCMWQRYPYVAVLVCAAMLLALPRYRTPLAWLSVLAFFVTSVIALFHVGVEQGWWEYASACSSLSSGGNIRELREAILNAPLVSCNQPQLTVLGLSMAAWNMLAGVALAVLVMMRIRKKEPTHAA